MTINTEQWLATLIEGHGTITLELHRISGEKVITVRPKVAFYSTNKRLLELVHEAFGYHGFRDWKSVNLQHHDAIEAIHRLYPFLERLQPAADVVLKFEQIRACNHHPYSMEVYDLVVASKKFQKREYHSSVLELLKHQIESKRGPGRPKILWGDKRGK